LEDQETKSLVDELRDGSMGVLQYLRDRATELRGGQKSVPRFSISQASQLVGRTTSAIREAEKDGRLPEIPRTTSGRRIGYTIGELNNMREIFGTRPWRSPEDPVSVIAVQNFKGGVGKSTIATHLAQYLAIQGYRTLLIDCDSQASSTSLFGYVPDLDLDETHSVLQYLTTGDVGDLRAVIRDTHLDGLHLIPANLHLYNAEYEMASLLSGGDSEILDRLYQGVNLIASDYDVIIMDPPPALGTISLSVMRAANSLLIPVPPTLMDFSSTTAFFNMLSETLETLAKHKMPVKLNWIRMLLSRANEQKSTHVRIIELMRKTYGSNLCRAVLRDSAEIDNASALMMTVYELEQPSTSHETYKRCLTHLNAVNEEIEILIRQQWPSQADQLLAEAAS
jgi:chromosome partitioning protein